MDFRTMCKITNRSNLEGRGEGEKEANRETTPERKRH